MSSTLTDFREKEFLDQITILNDIASEKDITLIPDLLDLFQNPVGDTSIDSMVVIALNASLSVAPDVLVEGLKSDDKKFNILCIRVAGEYGLTEATAPLSEMADNESDNERLMEILTALSRIRDPETMPIFRANLDSPDPYITSLSIEMAGVFQDTSSTYFLKEIILRNEEEDRYTQCEIATWKAIRALAAMGTDEGLNFLVEKLHHKNPTARRIITDSLIQLGEKTVPLLGSVFDRKNEDDKILAANILGFIGSRKGAGILVTAYDRNQAKDPNVRYALYEALGRIGTMKGIICLVDGLAEEDELILMAVMGGLERHVNPGMVETLEKMLARNDDQSRKLANAVIASQAKNLFQALYVKDSVTPILMDTLASTKDPEVVDAFYQVLSGLDHHAAQADIARLPVTHTGVRKALAVDDSRSMLALHRTILSDLGFEPFLASNGEEALGFVDDFNEFDIVVTDMNMPVMDGMELVEKLRSYDDYANVPIIMVTTESQSSQQVLATQAGVTAFITKPFKPEALKDQVRKLIS